MMTERENELLAQIMKRAAIIREIREGLKKDLRECTDKHVRELKQDDLRACYIREEELNNVIQMMLRLLGIGVHTVDNKYEIGEEEDEIK